MTENKTDIIISKETVKRLIKDVRDIVKHPLTENGIYYSHHETDILSGFALIIGPSDTIYANGFYLFEFKFPHDYPHRPPKVKYHTNDGVIRFHPNLYRNGKVCLSILNTWKGETWTSCQNIRTILLTLVTLFHNKPLLNEPGIGEDYKHFNQYNEIIEFKNVEIAILNYLTKERLQTLPEAFLSYHHIMVEHFKKTHKLIGRKIHSYLEEYSDTKNLYCDIYYRTEIQLKPKRLEEEFLNTLKMFKMKVIPVSRC